MYSLRGFWGREVSFVHNEGQLTFRKTASWTNRSHFDDLALKVVSEMAENNAWMAVDPIIHFKPICERWYMTLNRFFIAYPQNTPLP